jgi:hypothetical protein
MIKMKSDTEDLFRCEACGATFRDQDALLKHRVVHETDDKTELEQGLHEPTEHPTLPPAGFDLPGR